LNEIRCEPHCVGLPVGLSFGGRVVKGLAGGIWAGKKLFCEEVDEAERIPSIFEFQKLAKI
jgi:hypothetical protein